MRDRLIALLESLAADAKLLALDIKEGRIKDVRLGDATASLRQKVNDAQNLAIRIVDEVRGF